MKRCVQKIKKAGIVLFVFACIAFVSYRCEIRAYAYTQEEIDAAKAWLSANGYSPDEAGAAAAYADYMNGKFGAIPGLPEPNNVQRPEDSANAGGDAAKPEDTDTGEDSDADEDGDTDKDESSENTGQAGGPAPGTGENPAPAQGDEPPASETPENAGDTESVEDALQGVTIPPDIVLTEESKAQFSQMVSVFVDEFEEREQERIREAQERLERQKAAREEAEREAEQAEVRKKRPDMNVIVILAGVLVVAIGALLCITIRKKVK